MGTDLNAIRDLIASAQGDKDATPAHDKPQVTTDNHGRIRVSDSAPSDPALSTVEHSTFAAGETLRRTREAKTAREKMPPGTVYLDPPGAQGWYYSVTTEQVGNTYVFCAYFDGTNYKVRLIEPAGLEEDSRISGHAGHLYSGGLLCLTSGSGSGQPSLERAYSKSVLWAHGIDFVRAGYEFPFGHE